MSLPLFTTAPQWFAVPNLTAPYWTGQTVNLDNHSVPFGPFVNGANSYWIVEENSYPLGGTLTIAAYKTSTGSQPFTRIASSFNPAFGTGHQPSAFWDGSSSTVYFAWIDIAHHIYTSTFDLSTGAFGGLDDTGITLSGPDASNVAQLFMFACPNGDLYVMWDHGQGSGTGWAMHAVVKHSGSWGSQIDSVTTQQYLSLALLPSNKIGILSGKIYASPGGGETPAVIAYSTFDGSAFTLKISSTIPNYIDAVTQFPALYNPNSDTFIGCVADNSIDNLDAENICVYTVHPSDGSGGSIARTIVYNDPTDAFTFEGLSLVALPDWSEYYIYSASGNTGNFRQIYGFLATSPTGSWIGPTLAYDNDGNNSTPAGNLHTATIEILSPFQVTIVPDGRVGLLFGSFPLNQDSTQGAVVLFGPVGAPALTCPIGGTTGVVGTPYSATLVATGGVPPYTYAIISGSLPPGLSLDPATGIISGTPATVGAYTYIAQVTDSNGLTADTGPDGCTITITSTSLAAACPIIVKATLGIFYSQAIQVSGGTPPYTFALTSGSFPPGLSLNTSTGVISGTPSTAGMYTYTVTVTDSAGMAATVTITCTITVNLPCPSTHLPGSG